MAGLRVSQESKATDWVHLIAEYCFVKSSEDPYPILKIYTYEYNHAEKEINIVTSWYA